MEVIKVRTYLPPANFKSIEAAVAHAMSHPKLPLARSDAARLKGSVFTDACWTLSEWIIRFDCDLSLRIWIEHTEVCWLVQPSHDVLASDEFRRVGSPPITLKWANWLGLREMDCSSLVAKRRGARFKDLFVNHYGIFLYLYDHLIFQLSPIECVSDQQSIFYVLEDN